MPRVACTKCGFALTGVRRVMLMVEGRAMNEHHLCADCLNGVFDSLESSSSSSSSRKGVGVSA